jgi:murein DD-endopeptidase MepM/ murein hydrolase activator NlpD
MLSTRPLLAAAVLLSLLLLGCPSHPPVPEKPEESELEKSRFNYKAYSVKKGDTLISIGRRFEVPWQEIQRTNDASPNDLKIGQILLIPLHSSGQKAEGAAPEKPAQPEAPAPPAPTSPETLHRGKPSARWWWPTSGSVSRRYGQNVRGLAEPGIGISAPAGTKVHAVAAGRVLCVIHRPSAGNRGWGNVVAVQHPQNMVSWYGCLDRISVQQGDRVNKGQHVATVGASGAIEKPELALRFFRNERPVDPLNYLP